MCEVEYVHAQSKTCLIEYHIAGNFNDYIEDMMTFTVLAKINSRKCLRITKAAGLGLIFLLQKFSAIWYTVKHTYYTVAIVCC